MKHVQLFESWLSSLFNSTKPAPPESPKDFFIQSEMQDPTDPNSTYLYMTEVLEYESLRENLPKLIDVPKYYYYSSHWNGRTWLQEFVYRNFWSVLVEAKKTKAANHLMQMEFYGCNDIAYGVLLYLSEIKDEPIFITHSYLDKPCQIWIPKSILWKHFSKLDDAKAYVEDIKGFLVLAKKYPPLTWYAYKSPEEMVKLLESPVELSEFYDLLDPEFREKVFKLLGTNQESIEAIRGVKDIGLI